MPTLARAALAGVRLRGVDVRISRAAIWSRLFGGQPDPTRLGRFVVVERIGAGGMGVVYAAFDPQLDRKVALKVLRNDVVRARRASRQRLLLAEARAMARLSHANVVTVFEVGTVDDEVFVAMEFVDAPTLRRWQAAAPRSVAEILAVFVQAGRGLCEAHRAQLVHRDFKPENVLVPGRGPVQVTDFGLAVPLDAAEPDPREPAPGHLAPSGLTSATRELAGTPAYMAPEQLGQRSVDARADQYAFCVALFESLAGARPFDDATVLRMHAEPEFQPEPARVPDRRGLSSSAARAIERGLSFDPAARFEAMDTLVRALAPGRSGRRSVVMLAAVGGVAAGVAGLWVAAEKPCALRSDRLAGVWDKGRRGAAQRAFSATELPFAAEAWQRTRASLDTYADGWLATHRQACLATRRGEQSEALLDKRMRCLDLRWAEFAAATDVVVEADASVVENAIRLAASLAPVEACDDPTDSVIAQAQPDSPERAEAEAAIRSAAALRRAGKFDEALSRADDAVAAGESTPAAARALLERGRSCVALARVDDARASFERAIAVGGSAGQHETVAAAAIGLVEATGVVDAEPRDGLVLGRAAAIAVAAAGNPPRLVAELELARARTHYAAGALDEGLRHGQRGLELLEAEGFSAQAELADALQVQGTLAYGKRQLDVAQRFSKRALALRESVFGATHPAVAESLSTIAAIALAKGDVGAGVEAFERALALRRAALGDGHPDTAKTLANLASAKLAAGDLRGAEDGYVQALRQLEAAVGKDDPRVGAILQNLGGVRYDLGEVEAAVVDYSRAVEVQRVALGGDHPQLSVALANLGRAQLELGEAERAQELMEEALAIRTKALGAEHPQTTAAKMGLASVQAERGRLEEARALLESAAPQGAAQEAERALWLGRVALAERKHEEARRWLQVALDGRKGSAPAERAAAALLLAHAHAGLGDADAAAALAKRAAPHLTGARPPPELREFCATDCQSELGEVGGLAR